MKKIEDRLDLGEARFIFVEKNMDKRDEMLRNIERKMDRLPCVDRGGDCPEEKKKK